MYGPLTCSLHVPGKKVACATITHTPAEAAFCSSLTANKCFDLARSQHLSIPGFPDFRKAVSELKSIAPPQEPEYLVSISLREALVIKQALIDQWLGKPEFKSEMEDLLKNHNAELNPQNLKRAATAPSVGERPTKKLCLSSDGMSLDEFETKNPDRWGVP